MADRIQTTRRVIRDTPCRKCGGTLFQEGPRSASSGDMRKRGRCVTCRQNTTHRYRRTPHGYAVNLIVRNAYESRRRGYAEPNITPDEVVELIKAAGGRCMCCGEQRERGRNGLMLDHCHDTGSVRGLLCSDCNFAEGLLKTRDRWLAIGRYMGWDRG